MNFLKQLVFVVSMFISSGNLFAADKGMKETVAVHLEGGLGNQMFFVAVQAAYAKHFDKDVCLIGAKKSLINLFNLPFRPCSEDEILQAQKKVCSFPRFSPLFLKKTIVL